MKLAYKKFFLNKNQEQGEVNFFDKSKIPMNTFADNFFPGFSYLIF